LDGLDWRYGLDRLDRLYRLHRIHRLHRLHWPNRTRYLVCWYDGSHNVLWRFGCGDYGKFYSDVYSFNKSVGVYCASGIWSIYTPIGKCSVYRNNWGVHILWVHVWNIEFFSLE
jgi:hypothetical protein